MYDDEDDYTVEAWKELLATIVAMLLYGIVMLVACVVTLVAVAATAALPIACMYYVFNLPLMISLIIGAPISAIFLHWLGSEEIW